jgi:hypothetical protein
MHFQRNIERVEICMSVMFLQATAALFTNLLDNVFWGSFEPGVAGITGSLAGSIETNSSQP